MLLNKTAGWQLLEKHHQEVSKLTLSELFQQQPDRFEQLSLKLSNGLLLDYSKQRLTAETINLLCALAQEQKLEAAISALFSGEIVNQTEQRPALHTELRRPQPSKAEVVKTQAQILSFVTAIRHSDYRDVVVLGIGGSDLGPRLVCEALAPYRTSDLRLHFVANVDGDTLTPLLKKLQPATTLCIVISKTFTTIETLANAKLVKDWLHNTNSLVAVTANRSKALEFGVPDSQIFEFWDWVGGRYSVWSAVGLPIALVLGMENFRRLLAGAYAMDQHFRNADFAHNMPVLMALIGIWNINLNNYPTLAIQPYADGLQLLPAYLQQLEMESNGKSIANDGTRVTYQTAPVIWGGVGCNGQHAYMQLLHQGTQIVPVDFLVARQSIHGPQELQQLLVASCVGQSQALMLGKNAAESYKACSGNRPSSTLMFDKLTPEILGSIIALHEHKVFVQGVLWDIQSFDQWGVQLGKELIQDILQTMQHRNVAEMDSSTAGLLDYFWAEAEN